MQDASLLAAAEHRWQHMAALLAFIPTSKNRVNFRGGGPNDLGVVAEASTQRRACLVNTVKQITHTKPS